MNARTAARLAWSLWGATIALLVGWVLIGLVDPSVFDQVGILVVFNLFVVAFATVGALVASRHPTNPIGWLLSASAAAYAIGGLATGYQHYALHVSRGTAPSLPLLLWVGNWIWGLGAGVAATFVVLLFPDGRLPSRRWKPVAWMAGAGIALLVGSIALRPGPLPDTSVTNPLGIPGAEGVLKLLGGLGGFALLGGVLASIASLVVRFRRGDPEERQQLKWLTYAGGLVLVCVALSVVLDATGGGTDISNGLVTGSLATLPLAIGVAILKHGLYDIDVVINKTVVYGALAAFITAVYVGIVVGVGSLVGRRDEPNVALSIAATAVVAVAFQPVRARVQRLANRLVYGRRATPYELLAGFSDRVAGTYATEDVLSRLARVVAEGTGAARAEVWLRVGDELSRSASWPAASGTPPALPLLDGQVPPLPGAHRTLPVTHQGEVLGALAVVEAPGDHLRPGENKLLEDLASQAGLVLRNVRLTWELRARLEEISSQAQELRTSRKRLVAMQDAERRKLERNIHDGAQQHLVALAVRAKLARTLAEKDQEKARPLVEDLTHQTEEALDNLKVLASGIYPPLLTERGLAAALTSQAERSALPVAVEAEGLGRYSPEVEAAAYFCCLEALQNVAKYAGASRAVVRLGERDGQLAFSVTDDGRGFDPTTTPPGSGLTNLVDRVAALGGEIEVESAPGRGTTVAGTVPVRAPEPVSS